MDAQRALMDSLMGINRDGDRADLVISDWRDPRVCRNYLLGLCPHDLFANTKFDLGKCEKTHDDGLRVKFEKDTGGYEPSFLYEFERRLQGFRDDAKKKIERANVRLKEGESMAPPPLNVEEPEDVAAMAEQIKTSEAEIWKCKSSGEGDVLTMSDALDELRKEKSVVQARSVLAKMKVYEEQEAAESRVTQKLRVCDICGALLSVNDSEQRLADHFFGKAHDAYLKIQDRLEHIRTAPPPSSHRRDDRGRAADRDADRDRDRGEKDRHRHRSRSRSKDRGEKDRRSRDKAHDKEKEKDRRSKPKSRRRSVSPRRRSHREYYSSIMEESK